MAEEMKTIGMLFAVTALAFIVAWIHPCSSRQRIETSSWSRIIRFNGGWLRRRGESSE
jgi:hypothetical protein